MSYPGSNTIYLLTLDLADLFKYPQFEPLNCNFHCKVHYLVFLPMDQQLHLSPHW